MRLKSIVTFTAVLAAAAPMAIAQDGGGTWTVGLLAYGESSAYTDVGRDVTLLPYVSYDSDRLHFGSEDGLAYHLLPSGGNAQLSVVLSPRWETEFREGEIFDGLNRGLAIEAGVAGRYQAGMFFGEAKALFDVSGVHHGREIEVAIGAGYQAGRLGMEVRLGGRHRDQNLSAHLYGVSASEATGSRPAYDPGDVVSGFASLSASYGLTETTTLVGGLTYERLGDAVDSPLVEKTDATGLSLGVVYQF